MIGLEGAECHAPLAQAEKIDANLILAQLVGRAAVVRGQVTNSIDVDGLGSRRQSGKAYPVGSGHPHMWCEACKRVLARPLDMVGT